MESEVRLAWKTAFERTEKSEVSPFAQRVYFSLIAHRATARVDVDRLSFTTCLSTIAVGEAVRELIEAKVLVEGGSDLLRALPHPLRTAPDRGKPIVVVVEDDENVRAALVGLLGDFGPYDVYAAENGLHALHWLLRLPKDPDVAIIDVQMPILDGPGLIEVLKRAERHIPIAVFSALDPSRLRRLLPGVEVFIPKPTDVNVLCTMVGSMIASSAPLRSGAAIDR